MKKLLFTAIAAGLFTVGAIAQQTQDSTNTNYRQEQAIDQPQPTQSDSLQQSEATEQTEPTTHEGTELLRQDAIDAENEAESETQEAGNELRQDVDQAGERIESETEEAGNEMRQEANEAAEEVDSESKDGDDGINDKLDGDGDTDSGENGGPTEDNGINDRLERGKEKAQEEVKEGAEEVDQAAEEAGNELRQEANEAEQEMEGDTTGEAESTDNNEQAINADGTWNDVEIIEHKEGPNSEVVYKFRGETFYVDRQSQELVKVEESQLRDAKHDTVIKENK